MTEITNEQRFSKESIKGSEGESNVHFDAIHVIEYELNKNRRPNTPGLMGITAATELVKARISNNVIISGMHYKGKGEDSRRISEVYADELRQRTQDLSDLRIIPEAKTLRPFMADIAGSKDTGGDVSFLQRLAKKNGWNNILVVAYKPHEERITTLLKNRGVHVVTDDSPLNPQEVNVTILSSNDFLQRIHPHFEERFEDSPYRQREGTTFADKEAAKLKTMRRYDRKGYIISILARLMPQSIKEKLQS